MPGRIKRHYPVSNAILLTWQREVQLNISKVEKPSENVRAQLQRSKTRAKKEAAKSAQGGNLDNLVQAVATISNLLAVEAAAKLAGRGVDIQGLLQPGRRFDAEPDSEF